MQLIQNAQRLEREKDGVILGQRVPWFAPTALVCFLVACGGGLHQGSRQDSGDTSAKTPELDAALASSSDDSPGESASKEVLADYSMIDENLGPPDSAEVGGGGADGGDLSSAPADSGRSIGGAVLSASTGQGIGGRTVIIENRSTKTDTSGRFVFERVSDKYDVIIVGPGGWDVSIYYGLTSRNPILSDAASDGASLDTRDELISVSGSLTADFSFPVDARHLLTVYYLSNRGHSAAQIGAGLVSAGPDYGPIRIGWDGEPSIVGRVVAIGQYGFAGRPWSKGYVGSKDLSLSGGDTRTVDLALKECPTGRIEGNIQMYQGNLLKGVDFTYRLPNTLGLIGLGRCTTQGGYTCELPDLGELGGDYCVSIADVRGYAKGKRCGGRIGMSDFSLKIPAPPQFKNIADGEPISKESKLSWSKIPNGVYLLELKPDSPSAASPRVRVYTSASQVLWPDLGAMGVSFPAGATYGCKVSWLSPYASMDELATSNGPFNEQVDRLWLDSGEINLSLVQ